MVSRIDESVDYLHKHGVKNPVFGIILGSGLSDVGDLINIFESIEYNNIPGFCTSTVDGHRGKLIIGEVNRTEVLCMQGRFHYFEGYDFYQITFPVRVMQGLGIERLIITNAAGAVNTSFSIGDLMIIEDQINLMGTNPLIGKNLSQFGPRFPDMTESYKKNLINKIFACNAVKNLPIQKGVYVGIGTGPSYETPAEIKYIRSIGGDAVGMSTVPEVIVAKHGGMEVFGVSCITNMAAGVTGNKLDHKEVVESGRQVKGNLLKIITSVIDLWNTTK